MLSSSPSRSCLHSYSTDRNQTLDMESNIMATLKDPTLCKLRDRIQLRNVFEDCISNDSHPSYCIGNSSQSLESEKCGYHHDYVSSSALVHSINNDEVVKKLFTQRQLNDLIMFSHTNNQNELDGKGVKAGRGQLSWSDLIEFVNLIELRQRFEVSDTLGNKVIEEPPTNIPLESLALEIEVNDIIDRISIIVMRQDDKRLQSNPNLSSLSSSLFVDRNVKRLILNSKTSPDLLVKDTLENLKINPKWKSELKEKVSEAVLSCCRKELFHLLDGIRKQYSKCKSVYDITSTTENSHFAHLEIREQRNNLKEKILQRSQEVKEPGTRANQINVDDTIHPQNEKNANDKKQNLETKGNNNEETSSKDKDPMKKVSSFSHYLTKTPEQMELPKLMQSLISIQQDILKRKEELKTISREPGDNFRYGYSSELEEEMDDEDENRKDQNSMGGEKNLDSHETQDKEILKTVSATDEVNNVSNGSQEKQSQEQSFTDGKADIANVIKKKSALESTEEVLQRLRQEHNRYSTIMEFQRIDVDGDGSISRQEWRQWMHERAALIKILNQERANILNENARIRLALNLNDVEMKEEQENFDVEKGRIKATIMKQKLQTETLQNQIAAAKRQLNDTDSFLSGLGAGAY